MEDSDIRPRLPGAVGQEPGSAAPATVAAAAGRRGRASSPPLLAPGLA